MTTDPKQRAVFATYCGLTCLGGSEKRGCECRNPGECQMQHHPNFQHARNEAIGRMVRHMKRGWEEKETP